MARNSYRVQSEDWHTAGEPFRIVQHLPAGFLPDAQTVAERRSKVIQAPDHPLDGLRKSLSYEPRGYADMYGGFITPPNDSGASFGVLFWHKDGFSTACGHGTISLGYWAVSKGIVKAPENDGTVDVVVDVPSGRVVATLAVRGGKVIHGDFVNVSSYQVAKALSVKIPSRDAPLTLDLAFGGALFAYVSAAQLGLEVQPANANDFIKLSREIKASLGDRAKYGADELYAMLFFQDAASEDGEPGLVVEKSVNVYGDGQIDRSPCGSGTGTRLAVLLAEGRLKGENARFLNHSIIGSTFEARIVSQGKGPVEGFPACVPRVRGQANLVGQMRFFIDPEEPLHPGFVLR